MSTKDRVARLAIEDVLVEKRGVNEYDVNESAWVEKGFAEVQAWLDNARRNSKRVHLSVPIPGDTLRWGDLLWFDTLVKPRSWLENFHMDALLNLAAYNYDLEKRDAPRDWTILDMPVVNKLLENEFITKSAEPYLKGDKTVIAGLPWEKTSKLYGAANVGKDHWVLFMVSLFNQQVIVYDSLGVDATTIRAYFSNLCKNVSHILMSNELCGMMQFREPLRCELELLIFPNPPRQPNLHDCGVLVIKMLECIVREISLDEIDPRRCAIFRKSYCLQIRKWSVEEEAKMKARKR